MRELSVAMVRSLVNAVDQKDEYTSGHSVRVAYYACLLGRDLGLRKTSQDPLPPPPGQVSPQGAIVDQGLEMPAQGIHVPLCKDQTRVADHAGNLA